MKFIRLAAASYFVLALQHHAKPTQLLASSAAHLHHTSPAEGGQLAFQTPHAGLPGVTVAKELQHRLRDG